MIIQTSTLAWMVQPNVRQKRNNIVSPVQQNIIDDETNANDITQSNSTETDGIYFVLEKQEFNKQNSSSQEPIGSDVYDDILRNDNHDI